MRKLMIVFALIILSVVGFSKYLARPLPSHGDAKPMSVNSVYSPYQRAWVVDEIPEGWVKVADIKPAKLFLDQSVKTINASDVWKIKKNGLNITGIGSVTCLIDSGVNFSHPALVGRNATNFSVNCAQDSGCVVENLDNDVFGHGTHVAGIIAAAGDLYGVSFNSTIISVRVMNESQTIMSNWILNALDWCIANKSTYNIKTVSMSLGILNESFTSDCDSLDTTNVASKSNQAADSGLVVVAAAGNCYNGNTSQDCGYTNYNTSLASPACASKVISVGAYDESSGRVADFSQNSSSLDVVAPGVNINSSYPPNTYSEMNGTSMATPHVTGIVNLMAQVKPDILWNEALDILTKTAVDISDSKQGHGLVNALYAVNSLLMHWSINQENGYGSNISMNITVNNTGYVDEWANATIHPFRNWMNEEIIMQLSNGTHNGTSVMVFVKARNSSRLEAFNNSAQLRPGRYIGLFEVNSSTSYNSTNLTFDVPLNASANKSAVVNYSKDYDVLFVEMPTGLKAFSISNSSSVYNISIEVNGSSLLWNSSFPAENHTFENSIRIRFYNTSQSYLGFFNLSFNFSLFLPEYNKTSSDKEWEFVNLTMKYTNMTRNLSGMVLGLYNSSSKQDVPVSIYKHIYTKTVSIENGTNYSASLYIPANLSTQSDVWIDVKTDDEYPNIYFCRFFGDSIPAGDFPKQCNRLGFSFGSFEDLVVVNDDSSNHTYNITIYTLYVNDSYAGYMGDGWDIGYSFNVSGKGNGTDFNLSMMLIDNSSGRNATFNIPVEFLPDLMFNNTGGNVSVKHYFNKGHNSTLSLKIENPSIRVLNLQGNPCYTNSSFSKIDNESDSMKINDITADCSIPNQSYGWLNISLARNDSKSGIYRGWVMLEADKAYPYNYLNFTIDVEYTTSLKVILNQTYNETSQTNIFRPLENISINATVLYMDLEMVLGLNESNATVSMEGPNGEKINISLFLFNSSSAELNFTIPNITGGSWRIILAANDSFGNSGTGSRNITVNESNIDVSIISPTSAAAGNSVTAIVNVTNYGEVDEWVLLNASGCKSTTSRVHVNAHSYNDTFILSFSPSSSCSITINASNATFWNGTDAVSSKVYVKVLTVETTSTTSTSTTTTTTTAPQEDAGGGGGVAAQQTEESQEETASSNQAQEEEVFDFNISASNITFSSNGTLIVRVNATGKANFTIKLKSVNFDMQEKNATIDKTGEVEFLIRRGLLEPGVYSIEIVAKANGVEKRKTVTVTIIPTQQEISEAEMKLSYIREKLKEIGKRVNTTELEERADAIEELMEKKDYMNAFSMLRSLEAELESLEANQSTTLRKRNPSYAWIVVVVFIGLAGFAIYAISQYSKQPKTYPYVQTQPIQKYSFYRRKGLFEKIKELLSDLGKGKS